MKDAPGIAEGPAGQAEAYVATIDCGNTTVVVVSVSGHLTGDLLHNGTAKVTVEDGNGQPIPGLSGQSIYSSSDLKVKISGLNSVNLSGEQGLSGLPQEFSLTMSSHSASDGLGEDATSPAQCRVNPSVEAFCEFSQREVCVGQIVDIRLTISNTGTGFLSNVKVTDILPPGFEYVPNSSGGTCNAGEPTTVSNLVWTLPNGLPAKGQNGASCMIAFKARNVSCTGGTVSNSVQARGTFAGCVESAATESKQGICTIKCAKPAVQCLASSVIPGIACPGERLAIHVESKNNGDVAEDIKVTLFAQDGVTVLATNTHLNVPVGTTVKDDFTKKPDGTNITMPSCTHGSKVVFPITVSAVNAGGCPLPADDKSCKVEIVCREPDLSITKECQPKLNKVGDLITYSITFRNLREYDEVVRLSDRQDGAVTPELTSFASVEMPSVAASAIVNGRDITFPEFTLPGNRSCTITYRARLTSCTEKQTNIATIATRCGEVEIARSDTCETQCHEIRKCWLTGGGQSFDHDGHLHSYGGVVNPGCSPTAGGGGNWNDKDHTTGAHFKGTEVVVDFCENVQGIPPGSLSPRTPFNYIEFHGTGYITGVNGNKKRTSVFFNGHYEDRHEPGGSGQTDVAKKDRYFLRVYTDQNNPATSTVMLVDNDGSSVTNNDPAIILHGNLQLHISGCDKYAEAVIYKTPEIGGFDNESMGLPTEVSFGAPVPNPTGVSTEMRYALPREAQVSAKVFDVAGRVVRDLGVGPMAAGWHVLSWDLQSDLGQKVGPGLYFVRLSVDGKAFMRTVAVLH